MSSSWSAARQSLILALLLGTLVGSLGVGLVAGAPPPTQLCGVCQSEYGSDGIDGATGSGTLDIYVDGDGDSVWNVRVPVSDAAADRYRANRSVLAAAVDEAWARYHAAEDDVETVESTVDGDAVVVNYTVADVARPGVGDTWLVDYFVIEDGTGRYQLAAERVTIHAPPGAALVTDPPGAHVERTAATWTASADGPLESDFDRRTYIAFGDSGVAGTASGYASIALEIGPPAIEQGVRAGVIPGAAVGLAGLLVGRVDRGRDAFDLAGLERLLVAVGSVGALGLLAASVASTGRLFSSGLGALSPLGVGYASIAIVARRGHYHHTVRRVVVVASLVSLSTGALLWLLGGWFATAAFLFALATALFLPMGYVSDRRSGRFAPVFFAAIAGGAVIASAVVLSLILTPRGLGVYLYWLLLAFWASVVITFGYPVALVGRQLAAADRQQ